MVFITGFCSQSSPWGGAVWCYKVIIEITVFNKENHHKAAGAKKHSCGVLLAGCNTGGHRDLSTVCSSHGVAAEACGTSESLQRCLAVTWAMVPRVRGGINGRAQKIWSFTW